MPNANTRAPRDEILIVEDSPTQAEQLRHLLEGRGFSTRVAANGREALETARAASPSLVVSDVLMPEMDGYELCRIIKDDAALAQTPVLLLTSLASPQDVLKALECGADSFIRKPYGERDLLSRIDFILANQHIRATERTKLGVEVVLGGRTHLITAARQQTLDLLISTYEDAVRLNEELQVKQAEILRSAESLRSLYRIAEALNRSTDEETVVQETLGRALELPDVAAGWIFLRTEGTNFRVVSRGLDEAAQGTLLGDEPCFCQSRLLSGALDQVTNVTECERLRETADAPGRPRYHASVPLRVGGQAIGIMNLAGPSKRLFNPDEMNLLTGIGNQVGLAIERARLYHHLEREVEKRTAALRSEVAERRRAEQQVHQLNLDLERRVRERTAELEAANRELEAFSYSVSHDLRAPLRAIDGFSRAIDEDFHDTLAPNAKAHLDRVRAATTRMAQLIDDLLGLARVSRGEMQRQPVDLSAIVEAVCAELQRGAPERLVTFAVAPGVVANGDRRLLQVLLENLLGNAWKYTGKQAQAHVEFGIRSGAPAPIYFVSDDGVGFDMRYADKLFLPFQRLHSAADFEGTGIGLATVDRVVRRHGGRVWAESSPDHGATFFFTLEAEH